MNDLAHLLPPRRPVPPLPERGGPLSIAGAARLRRRRRGARAAGATTLAALALAGLVAVRPAPESHGLTVEPGPTPSASHAGRGDDRPNAAPGASPLATSAPAAADPTARVPGRVPPPPSASVAAPPLPQYTRIDRSLEDADPTDACELRGSVANPAESLCVRYLGPGTVEAGQPAGLVFDFCANTTDVSLHFASGQEIRFVLTDAAGQEAWMGIAPPGGAAHDVAVPWDTCLRYVAHWTGLRSDGTKPDPGTYAIDAWLLVDGWSAAAAAPGQTFSITIE